MRNGCWMQSLNTTQKPWWIGVKPPFGTIKWGVFDIAGDWTVYWANDGTKTVFNRRK